MSRKLAFIGLGNMGSPMALNLIKAGYSLKAYDIRSQAAETVVAAGATHSFSAQDAARGVDAVITMLPSGADVCDVYLGTDGVIAAADQGTLLIDSSTIDVETARTVSEAAEGAGMEMVDAPVSGGVAGAENAALTFMVGGTESSFARSKPILEGMGRKVIHAGGAGTGQAAKICNNMILGISMIAVSEAFVLAERLNLDAQRLFEIASQASGQCWALTSYCPVPGPVPTSPANRDYEPGFTAAMMLKDLRLSQEAAQKLDVATPLGAQATALYTLFSHAVNGKTDYSGIIKMIRGGDLGVAG